MGQITLQYVDHGQCIAALILDPTPFSLETLYNPQNPRPP
jgi:hypothetical protein